MTLSKTQQKILDVLSENEWKSAYELKASLATLFALERKGLIERKKNIPFWLGWERTSILWRKKS